MRQRIEHAKQVSMGNPIKVWHFARIVDNELRRAVKPAKYSLTSGKEGITWHKEKYSCFRYPDYRQANPGK